MCVVKQDNNNNNEKKSSDFLFRNNKKKEYKIKIKTMEWKKGKKISFCQTNSSSKKRTKHKTKHKKYTQNKYVYIFICRT